MRCQITSLHNDVLRTANNITEKNERRVVWMSSHRAGPCAWCCCLTTQSVASLHASCWETEKAKVPSVVFERWCLCCAVCFLLKWLHWWTLGSWMSFLNVIYLSCALEWHVNYVFAWIGSVCYYSAWSKFKYTTSPTCDTAALKEVRHAATNNFY